MKTGRLFKTIEKVIDSIRQQNWLTSIFMPFINLKNLAILFFYNILLFVQQFIKGDPAWGLGLYRVTVIGSLDFAVVCPFHMNILLRLNKDQQVFREEILTRFFSNRK